MEIITEGHQYILGSVEGGSQRIDFIHKVHRAMDMDDVLQTIADGTTNEEVLRVLIDRMNFLQAKMPCRENAIVITKLEESLMWLEKRTAHRVQRGVEGTHKV